MKSLLQDLRYSVRQLWSSPGFSVTAILSLALGIAATTAVFSVIYAVLMNPYPYRAPDRTLTDEEVAERRRAIATALTSELSGRVRDA